MARQIRNGEVTNSPEGVAWWASKNEKLTSNGTLGSRFRRAMAKESKKNPEVLG